MWLMRTSWSMTGKLKKRNASQSQMRATEKRNTRRNPASQIYIGNFFFNMHVIAGLGLDYQCG
jgi:hypothetical protein